MEALEYLHSCEYVHADIKGSNLLTGFSSADRHKVCNLAIKLHLFSYAFTETGVARNDRLFEFALQVSTVLHLLYLGLITAVLELKKFLQIWEVVVVYVTQTSSR